MGSKMATKNGKKNMGAFLHEAKEGASGGEEKCWAGSRHGGSGRVVSDVVFRSVVKKGGGKEGRKKARRATRAAASCSWVVHGLQLGCAWSAAGLCIVCSWVVRPRLQPFRCSSRQRRSSRERVGVCLIVTSDQGVDVGMRPKINSLKRWPEREYCPLSQWMVRLRSQGDGGTVAGW